MRKEFLGFAPPCLSDQEVEAVAAVLREGIWLSSGPQVKQFETEFADYVRAETALALNSCTAGLHLSMCLLDVGPGDQVITTPLTFCATANVVEHRGADVVFVDVEPDTLLIDARKIEAKITTRTKVILPVHYAGHPADMPTIDALAKAHKVSVVEDAAHCMPSKVGEQMVGGSGHLTLFSFYPTKNMTTGEGGMMTGPKDLVDRARSLALHGMSKGAWDRFKKGGNWRYDVVQPGWKYNMTDIAAALGRVQLQRLAELYARRMRVVQLYEQAWGQGHELLTPLRVKPGFQSSYHLYVVQLELDRLHINRDDFINQMSERNIGTSVHYWPLHRMSYYANKYKLTPEDFPNATRAGDRMVSLPLSSRMTEADAQDVIEAVEDVLRRARR
jgi:dTDP-4-amino-4,6-dideoxygalactose transaminase